MAIPVSLADARRQLRLDDTDTSRDTELEQFIADAAAWVELYTGQTLVAADVVEQFLTFERMQLRAWPVKPDAAVSVNFTDAAGAAITIVGPRVRVVGRPAQVLPAVGTRWPPVGPGVVAVTVRAGYEIGDAVPGSIRRAILVLIAAYDADREGGELFAAAEATARSLCDRANLRLRTL